MGQLEADLDNWDAFSYLFASKNRYRILQALPASFTPERDIAATVDASRATVHRTLVSFTDTGWAKRRQTEYKLSHAGRLFAHRIRRWLSIGRTLEVLGPLLDRAASVDVEIDPSRLADEAVTCSTARRPTAALRAYEQRLTPGDADRIDGYFERLTTLEGAFCTDEALAETTCHLSCCQRSTTTSVYEDICSVHATTTDVDIHTAEHTPGAGGQASYVNVVVFDTTKAIVSIADSNQRIRATATVKDPRVVSDCLGLVVAIGGDGHQRTPAATRHRVDTT